MRIVRLLRQGDPTELSLQGWLADIQYVDSLVSRKRIGDFDGNHAADRLGGSASGATRPATCCALRPPRRPLISLLLLPTLSSLLSLTAGRALAPARAENGPARDGRAFLFVVWYGPGYAGAVLKERMR